MIFHKGSSLILIYCAGHNDRHYNTEKYVLQPAVSMAFFIAIPACGEYNGKIQGEKELLYERD
jgi:hypothetical protein